MLVIKQVEPETEGELAYECYDNGEKVGRLTARMRPDGLLEAHLSDISRREAGRSLAAKLERDAASFGLPGLYLLTRDEKERDQFLSGGYDPVEENSLLLFKPLDT